MTAGEERDFAAGVKHVSHACKITRLGFWMGAGWAKCQVPLESPAIVPDSRAVGERANNRVGT